MLSQEQIKLIREKDFPPESVQVKTSFKDPTTGKDTFLTGYKPQYIIERLNDVFGHDGWDYEIIEHGIEGGDAWTKGRLTIYNIEYIKDTVDGPVVRQKITVKEQFGTGSYNKGTSLGDSFKSSATNALEKCASLVDIGHLAYKGLVDVPDGNEKKPLMEIDKLKTELAKKCKELKIDKVAFVSFVKNVLKEEKAAKDLTKEELSILIEHLEKNKAPF